MHWETWALVALSAFCAAISIWIFIGDYLNNRSDGDARFLRLSLTGGGHIDIPANSRRAGHRQHAQHRAG